MYNTNNSEFMQEAIRLSIENVTSGKGGPFGAVIVKDGVIIARGVNEVTSSNDPTAHAEVVAIRNACKALGTFQLDGCVIYTSCEPCPMCLGAIYWSRPAAIFYAGTREDAAAAGFDDEHFYSEMEKANDDRELRMVNLLRWEARQAFDAWIEKTDK